MTKITRTTFKNFVARELKNDNLYIKLESKFDGMTDCVQEIKDVFSKAEVKKDLKETDVCFRYTLGIRGIWLVDGSRNSYDVYEDEKYIGYKVCNSCGSFIVAAKK